MILLLLKYQLETAPMAAPAVATTRYLGSACVPNVEQHAEDDQPSHRAAHHLTVALKSTLPLPTIFLYHQEECYNRVPKNTHQHPALNHNVAERPWMLVYDMHPMHKWQSNQ